MGRASPPLPPKKNREEGIWESTWRKRRRDDPCTFCQKKKKLVNYFHEQGVTPLLARYGTSERLARLVIVSYLIDSLSSSLTSVRIRNVHVRPPSSQHMYWRKITGILRTWIAERAAEGGGDRGRNADPKSFERFRSTHKKLGVWPGRSCEKRGVSLSDHRFRDIVSQKHPK